MDPYLCYRRRQWRRHVTEFKISGLQRRALSLSKSCQRVPYRYGSCFLRSLERSLTMFSGCKRSSFLQTGSILFSCIISNLQHLGSHVAQTPEEPVQLLSRSSGVLSRYISVSRPLHLSRFIPLCPKVSGSVRILRCLNPCSFYNIRE